MIALRLHGASAPIRAQSEVSTLAVLLLTYFIALVVWRTNPEQMGQFLATSVGQWAVAGTILMQAVGLVWMSFISRLTILRQVDENTRRNKSLAGAGRPDVPGLRSVPPPGHESAESGKAVHGTGRSGRATRRRFRGREGSSAVGSSWRAIANRLRLPRSSRQCSWQSALGLAAVFAIRGAGLTDELFRNIARLPPGVGDLLVPIAYLAPWTVFLILVLVPWLVVRRSRRQRVEAGGAGLAHLLGIAGHAQRSRVWVSMPPWRVFSIR